VTVGVLRAFGDWVVVREGSFAVVSVTGISISCAERILGENSVTRRSIMNFGYKFAMALAGAAVSVSTSSADTLPTHRIPAALAVEAASETIAVCGKQGYRETAVVLDADGATIVAVRGDGAGIHTLDSAHDKAYTSVSFKNDTIALAERAKGEDSIAPLAKLPHVMFFGGGVVIKLGDETIGAIGASGAPGAKLDDNCARAGLDKIRDRLR
jgi:uncharacterized protein GlcG (DUF336 family)